MLFRRDQRHLESLDEHNRRGFCGVQVSATLDHVNVALENFYMASFRDPEVYILV